MSHILSNQSKQKSALRHQFCPFYYFIFFSFSICKNSRGLYLGVCLGPATLQSFLVLQVHNVQEIAYRLGVQLQSWRSNVSRLQHRWFKWPHHNSIPLRPMMNLQLIQVCWTRERTQACRIPALEVWKDTAGIQPLVSFYGFAFYILAIRE